jgi:hypothetical protein
VGFSWTNDITKNTAFVKAAALQEIRTNIDNIKDNLACITHKATYDTTKYTGDHQGYYANNLNSYDATYNGSLDSSYNDGKNTSDLTSDNQTYWSGDDNGNRGSNYSSNRNDANSSVNWGVNTSYHSNYDDAFIHL